MHAAVHEFIRVNAATDHDLGVVEIGSRDINGSVRDLFPEAEYVGVDIMAGKGVDVVADATTWAPEFVPDIVLCLEVFEHIEDWGEIVEQVATYLDGQFFITCAAVGRKPHSAIDGAELREDEFYKNLTIGELRESLEAAGFTEIQVNKVGDDLQASAVMERG